MANLSSRNQQVRQASAPLSAGRAGFIQQYAGTSAPSGWLECSGQAVSRTDYADLFANVGTKYGVGDGSTTFNLPDGPRRTNEVDLSLSSTPTGWSTITATGHLEQSAEGQLYLHFLIYGAYTVSTGNQSITIDGISASINGQAVACMGEASAGYNAFFNSGVITMYTGGTGTNDLRVQGRIIIDSASDTFVDADANYSTLSEAWESIPIIKLYDDVADAVSVGVAEATSTTAGTSKTSEAADTTEQYLIPEYREASFSTNVGTFTGGTLDITRVGRTVTITSQGLLSHSSSGSPITTSALPVWARPQANTYNCYIFSGGVWCAAIVLTSGVFQIQYRNSAGSAVSRTNSLTAITISYSV